MWWTQPSAEETPGLFCHTAWVSGPGHRAQRAQGNTQDCPEVLGDAARNSCHHLTRALLGTAGMSGKSLDTEHQMLGTCKPARELRRCQRGRALWGQGGGLQEEGTAAGTAGGHTAGTQQGLNKCLLNLFSCSVWSQLLSGLWLPCHPSCCHSKEPESESPCVLRPGPAWAWGTSRMDMGWQCSSGLQRVGKEGPSNPQPELDPCWGPFALCLGPPLHKIGLILIIKVRELRGTEIKELA